MTNSSALVVPDTTPKSIHIDTATAVSPGDACALLSSVSEMEDPPADVVPDDNEQSSSQTSQENSIPVPRLSIVTLDLSTATNSNGEARPHGRVIALASPSVSSGALFEDLMSPRHQMNGGGTTGDEPQRVP
jgi:hypothetical protein